MGRQRSPKTAARLHIIQEQRHIYILDSPLDRTLFHVK